MSDPRLHLSQVTLCAVTSVNVAATVRALEMSLEQVSFAACKLLTDANDIAVRPGIEVVRIAHLGSSAAYSDFMLRQLVNHVETTHCLVVQWDGHLLHTERWRPEFLEYDYIGAVWPQFDDGHDVGNGGFSLRSRRLMALCGEPAFARTHPEDVAIGRTNRLWLERQGIQFAPRVLADLFAAERSGDPGETFGYHGVWNMPQAVGVDDFWKIYRTLDERKIPKRDFVALLKAVWRGPEGNRRVGCMLSERFRSIMR